jgi:Zn finger protein HypA/HybF involved in hydrogenase expression
MGFAVEQACPQCGATIELDETDHLIICPYCRIKNYLFAKDYFRFLLPAKASNYEIIYTPYMRFKGSVYLCEGEKIDYGIVDLTYQATHLKQLPLSLGLRPQAMQMHFVTPDATGSFLSCSLNPSDVLAEVGKRTSAPPEEMLFHRVYVGEAFSLIYLPLHVRDGTVFDAVINKPIAVFPDAESLQTSGQSKRPAWRITFMATICPQCGGNLDGERDSVVLTCPTCETAWEASEGHLMQIDRVVFGGDEKGLTYVPFWQVVVREEGVGINTHADLMQIAQLSSVNKYKGEEKALSFWLPAFKVRPREFLRLASQITVRPPDGDPAEGISPKTFYPVTLPREEVAQCLKVVLANIVTDKKGVFPLLPRINFNVTAYTLIYLPFKPLGLDMVQEETGICVNKNVLKYGRFL